MSAPAAAFAAAVLLSLALTPVAMRVAFRFQILDRPDRRLKRHRAPVPYLGGAAIFVAFTAAVLGMKMWEGPGEGWERLRGVLGIVGGATVVFLLGLFDDARPLRPGTKLLVQTAAAFVPVACGIHIKFIDNPLGAIPLTVLWIVGVTNAFNLLDILDGLCAGIAAIAAGWFWLIAAENGRANDALVAAALAGSVLGFLRYNWPPARVFMGDAGSLTIGFLLATTALGLGYSLSTNLGVLAPLLILGVPLFETVFVMTVRWQQGKPVMQGSPDHAPLRMVRLGWTRPGAVRLLWAVSAALGAVAYAVVHVNWERALLLVGATGILALLAAIRLALVSMAPPAR